MLVKVFNATNEYMTALKLHSYTEIHSGAHARFTLGSELYYPSV